MPFLRVALDVLVHQTTTGFSFPAGLIPVVSRSSQVPTDSWYHHNVHAIKGFGIRTVAADRAPCCISVPQQSRLIAADGHGYKSSCWHASETAI